MFRYKHNRELFWAHKKQIAEDFRTFLTTHTEDGLLKGSAAWQIAFCHATSFGVPTNWSEADKHFLQAIKLKSNVAQKFGPMLLRSGADHEGECYTETVLNMLSSSSQLPLERLMGSERTTLFTSKSKMNALFAEAHPTVSSLQGIIDREQWEELSTLDRIHPLSSLRYVEPPLHQGLRTRNVKVVRAFLACGLSPEAEDKENRNCFHWLFMLDRDAPSFAEKYLTEFKCSKALNTPATSALHAHP